MPNNASGYEILHNKSKLWTDVAKFWKQMALPIMASCARQLVRVAAKYSPPGINHTLGNATIPEEYYYCRIINIDALAKQYNRRKEWGNGVDDTGAGPLELQYYYKPRRQKKKPEDRTNLVLKKKAKDALAPRFRKKGLYDKKYHRHGKQFSQKRQFRMDKPIQNFVQDKDLKIYPDDWEAWKQGKKYKVVSNKWKQIPHTIGYTESMAQAKKMARIVNRGLAKYSWNTLLNNFADSEMVSTKPVKIKTTQIERDRTFNTLARRSPNIKRYTWGNIKFDSSDINNWNWKLHGEQRHNADEEYSPLALKLGIVAAGKRWNSLVQAFAKQNGKTLQRLLGFKLQSIIANPNTIATGPRYK